MIQILQGLEQNNEGKKQILLYFRDSNEKKNAGSKTKGDMFTRTKNIFKPFKFIQYDTILNYTCSLVEI